ncbi:glycoside hydrolase family 24 [Ancylobacter novellus DSM 506]|uniref:Lysozyme n=1 Tax=Ancylobacter novellus (strain ATCC 8093 / DSM 506 / JCM 20403 / CCM 1077 / IAM 12100 / NBRC 12443 / NCIMB 10456) TaxID=639283 RepID=D6ZZV7_ANCN5|nr:lysozyme [Ancylobacter novellus]ADH87371.1 glycoside hydrolase family 24 [Ancylobacter novellus DSM 506]
MPITKLRPTGRARAAIAAVMALAISIGGIWYVPTSSGKQYPAAVVLAAEHIIKGWEGLRLIAYRDIVGVWTICYGETKGVRAGMRKTAAECEALLYERVYRDFYIPMSACAAPAFVQAPVPVQAAMLGGGYNFGVGGWCGSTTARYIRAKLWRQACDAQTAWNRAGGKVVQGLVNRREMGDASRIGEGELCVTGLQ